MGDRVHDQSGNTLALFPAAVMVMFVLASMAIDAALTFSAQRQLADVASAAANDAASAVAERVYDPDDPHVALDPARARARVQATLERRTDVEELDADCADTVVDGDTVTVTCTGTVRQLVSPARFLGVVSRDVTARATARAVPG